MVSFVKLNKSIDSPIIEAEVQRGVIMLIHPETDVQTTEYLYRRNKRGQLITNDMGLMTPYVDQEYIDDYWIIRRKFFVVAIDG